MLEDGLLELRRVEKDRFAVCLFEDIDAIQNGFFIDKDTILSGINKRVYLDIVLEEK